MDPTKRLANPKNKHRNKAGGVMHLNDGTKAYEKLIEDKNLPAYWYQKYSLFYRRLRKHYGIVRYKGNPLQEVLLEKIAYVSIKMQYIESPDFYKETGIPIENPIYLDKWDSILKIMLKFIEQMQKYTEPKPPQKKETKKLVVNINKDLKEIPDADLNSVIRQLTSGEEEAIEVIALGKNEKESDTPEQSESS